MLSSSLSKFGGTSRCPTKKETVENKQSQQNAFSSNEITEKMILEYFLIAKEPWRKIIQKKMIIRYRLSPKFNPNKNSSRKKCYKSSNNRNLILLKIILVLFALKILNLLYLKSLRFLPTLLLKVFLLCL
jgi:hypothetical protein